MKELLISTILFTTALIPAVFAQSPASPSGQAEAPASSAPGGAESGDKIEEQEAKVRAAMQKMVESLNFKTGKVDLNHGVATLNLPEGFQFLDSKDATRVIVDLWGNPPGAAGKILGLIVPPKQDITAADGWAVVVTYDEDGYVSDEDADKINYDDLLKQLKESNAKANKERVKEGYGKLELVGWAVPPSYDMEKKVMYWARELAADDPEHTVNYAVRVLGRKGVLVLNGVAPMSQLKTVEAATPDIVSLASFNSGYRYSDFDASKDKKADYTLAGLVIGGAVAAKLLAKGGFLVILAKFGKLLIIPVIAAGSWLKRLFSRRTE